MTGAVDAPGITPAPVKGTDGGVKTKFKVSVEFEAVDPLVDEPVVDPVVVEVELVEARVSDPEQSLLTL